MEIYGSMLSDVKFQNNLENRHIEKCVDAEKFQVKPSKYPQ